MDSRLSPEQRAQARSLERAHARYAGELLMAYLAFGDALSDADWLERIVLWEQVMKSDDVGEAMVQWYRMREEATDAVRQIRARPN